MFFLKFLKIQKKIRGYLHSYSIILPASQAFDKCTACCNQVKSNIFLIYSFKLSYIFFLSFEKIIEMYRKEGFEFLIKVFNDSSYLEDITGLKELKAALDETESEFVTEISDNESI